jgi:type II restriction/modification system DNA methylase subunit YeeA
LRRLSRSGATARSGAQGHFIALCRLLGIPSPTEADPHGDWFAFEKGAKKTGGGDGWADVWRRHCFAWEYKGKHRDLKAALRQLQQYALALENPPLLIVSDIWWRHGEARPGLRRKLAGLTRYIATPETAKHRFFVWFPVSAAPEHSLIVIPRDDDVTFGILSSRFHTVWALAKGGRMGYGNDPRYNSTMTFETFPFPSGLTPNIPASEYADDPRAQAIAAAARTLNELRENWLNPPQWVDRIPEVVPGYPDRIVPKSEHAAELKKRTLTNLYNQRPAWLDHAHRVLDEAVAAAYGWPVDLSDDEILRRLLTLNLERTGQ